MTLLMWPKTARNAQMALMFHMTKHQENQSSIARHVRKVNMLWYIDVICKREVLYVLDLTTFQNQSFCLNNLLNKVALRALKIVSMG